MVRAIICPIKMKTDPKSNIIIAIISLITILSWVGFEVWHTYHTSTITPEIVGVLNSLSLSNVSSSSWSVSWTTKAKTRGEVWWGESAGRLDHQSFDDRETLGKTQERSVHYVTIRGGAPKIYYFKIGVEDLKIGSS